MLNCLFSAITPAEDLERFQKDPKEYRKYRRYVEDLLNRPVEALYKGSPGAKMFVDMCRTHMQEKLKKKPEVFEALVPDYPVGCRRITPGPGVSPKDSVPKTSLYRFE